MVLKLTQLLIVLSIIIGMHSLGGGIVFYIEILTHLLTTKKKKKKILENQVVKKILWEMKYDFLFTEKYFDKHIHTYSVKQKIKKIK